MLDSPPAPLTAARAPRPVCPRHPHMVAQPAGLSPQVGPHGQGHQSHHSRGHLQRQGQRQGAKVTISNGMNMAYGQQW
jgi:hypothetical protein